MGDVQHGSEAGRPTGGVCSRRSFLSSSAMTFVAPLLAGCGEDVVGPGEAPRLSARPGTPGISAPVGESQLGLREAGPDGLLYVPTTYNPGTPLPLFVMLHGAGGSATGLEGVFTWGETNGFAVLLPEARGRTWDRVTFGSDVGFLDLALEHVFERVRIDPTRIALAGFSDGASYALSLGVSNGDLFTHLLGFSPGYFLPSDPVIGKPRVFISHGTFDSVITISASRDNIAPWFSASGYDLTYEAWAGGHSLTAETFGAGVSWWWSP